MTTQAFNCGSEWRRWDLHVHTPASIFHRYGGESDVWEKYLQDLEKLPSEFSVLGINDYLFLDGYERLVEEKTKNGRLRNIDLLLPVVEFRIDKFAGVDFKKLKRINFHVIFSNTVTTETIRSQFLSTLEQSYTLEADGSDWNRAITLDSLTELGQKIRAGIPDDKPADNRSDLEIGFHNLNVSLDQIKQSLAKDCFHGKVLTAVGKTEWGKVSWTPSSIATKKTIINQADLVFTSAESQEAYETSKISLISESVNSNLLDCSDAHSFSHDVHEKDRIGNCLTWIKANPTFDGLKQIVQEPERVYVGDEPDLLKRVRENPTRFIKNLKLKKLTDAAFSDTWFDGIDVDFNCGLVAIIGNKGNGKSAIADILALCGNSRQERRYFSFLTKEKFADQKANRFAEYFTAELTWHYGDSSEKLLSQEADLLAPERVKYIPQRLFEVICTDVDTKGFNREIEKIIFDHIDEADRLGFNTLEDLISHRTMQINLQIASKRNEISAVNIEVDKLELLLMPTARESLVNELELKTVELRAHDENKPQEGDVPTPEPASGTTETEIAEIAAQIATIDGEMVLYESEKISITRRIELLRQVESSFENLNHELTRRMQSDDSMAIILQQNGIEIGDVFSFTVNIAPIRSKLEQLLARLNQINFELDKKQAKSKAFTRVSLETRLSRLKETLDLPARSRRLFVERLEQWEKNRSEIIGSKDTAGTVEFLQDQINIFDKILPHRLSEEKEKRIGLFKELYRLKVELKEVRRQLYDPITSKIRDESDTTGDQQLAIEVSFNPEGFYAKFLEFVNRNRVGTFYGSDDAPLFLRTLVEKTDFESESGIEDFVEEILDALNRDKRNEKNEATLIRNQLKGTSAASDFYDFLFSLEYLEPVFSLKLGAKDLDKLSPGERGSLLLMFFLNFDKDEIPLVIDQPEDNLDNESIYKNLVALIRSVKKRRQIFMVTHNPNLALGCDADQIIHVEIDKQNGNRFSFQSGGIEDFTINTVSVNVLEGTLRAFDSRGAKWLRSAA